MSPPVNPMTDQDRARIVQAQQLIAQAQDMLRRLHACGSDCQGQMDAAALLARKAAAYKAQWFGG